MSVPNYIYLNLGELDISLIAKPIDPSLLSGISGSDTVHQVCFPDSTIESPSEVFHCIVLMFPQLREFQGFSYQWGSDDNAALWLHFVSMSLRMYISLALHSERVILEVGSAFVSSFRATGQSFNIYYGDRMVSTILRYIAMLDLDIPKPRWGFMERLEQGAWLKDLVGAKKLVSSTCIIYIPYICLHPIHSFNLSLSQRPMGVLVLLINLNTLDFPIYIVRQRVSQETSSAPTLTSLLKCGTICRHV